MLRPAFVLVHRYVGLVMAGFLVLAGATGCILVWYEELDAAISPELFRVSPPEPGAMRLDPFLLREKVQAAYPASYAYVAPLMEKPGHALVYYLKPPPGRPPQPINVFVNPYTGDILGDRTWGDLSEGMKNLMPFIYRLHFSLALGTFGTYAFGIVALLWTLDCFAGAYLTFPPARKSFWRQWGKSWRVRTRNAYTINFDLHRAGGLWLWAMLFVLAWSSVAFNLREVYDPVMRTFFAVQDRASPPPLAEPLSSPPLTWEAARAHGRRLMAAKAAEEGFIVDWEWALFYDPQNGHYRYSVHSSRDVAERWGNTQVTFSGRDGAVFTWWLPTGAAAGDTIRSWITSLHMAVLWGVPFKIFMTLMGGVVATLSATGVIIWAKKRAGRRQSRAHSVTSRGMTESRSIAGLELDRG